MENLYRLLINQPKVDDLEKEIKKIYLILNKKADIDDLELLKKKYDELYRLYLELLDKLKSLENRISKIEKYDLDKILKDINELKLKLESIYSKILEGNSGGKIDISIFVDFDTFNKYKEYVEEELEKLRKALGEINLRFNNVLKIIDNKADLSLLINIEKDLNKKIEDLKISSIKRFADKNDTNNNFKLIEQQLKLLFEMKGQNAENWLLAKKPMGGNYCASCETYIGDLKENKEFISWNRWPNKDVKGKRGPGFSRMLQLINADTVNLEEYDNLNEIYNSNNSKNYLNKLQSIDEESNVDIRINIEKVNENKNKNIDKNEIGKSKVRNIKTAFGDRKIPNNDSIESKNTNDLPNIISSVNFK